MKIKLCKTIKKLFKLAVIATILVAITILSIDRFVVMTADDYIYSAQLPDGEYDCILVLGCAVKADRTPSAMLEDRLDTAIELYKDGVAPKIIVSGDHGQEYYDEVSVMREYCIENGVPDEDIFMDHAGFSTYESMYRAREIFEVSKMVVVTQEYHLYRAVYSARALGIEAYGVPAENIEYSWQFYRDGREVLARVKDFVFVLLDVQPTFLGDAIPVTGDGNQTLG